MPRPIRSALLLLSGLLPGIWLGWTLHQPPEAQATPAPPAPRERRVVCTNVTAPEPVEAQELGTRLEWCEARLSAATRVRPTGRKEWPEDMAGAESPEDWPATAEALLARCQPDVKMEVVDCEEYPCVAALRGPEGIDVEAMRKELKRCAQTDAALAEQDIELGSVTVRCPDGSTETALVFSLWDQESPVLSSVFGGREVTFADYIIHAGRRAESAVQLWSCDGGE